jgi:hypothetical protein
VEVATGGDIEVLTQILAHGSLRLRPLAPSRYAMIDTPNVEGQPLAQVSKNYFELRILILDRRIDGQQLLS